MRRSILEYFLANAVQCSQKTAALAYRDGAFREVTWGQMAVEARRISAGLVALGVRPGDRVCLMAETSLTWVLADLGILGAGAVTVPIYPSNLADECQYVAEDCEAVVALVDDEVQVQKFRAERARLPYVTQVVQLCGKVEGHDGWVMSLDALNAQGAGVDDGALETRRDGLSGDSVLTIIYTSGTTGPPKGVVITHANMAYEAEACAQIHIVDENDTQLLWLPLAHSFARVLSVAWLSTRHVVAFAKAPDRLSESMREVRPTVMAGVPRMYEKLHAAVVQKATLGSRHRAGLFRAAMESSAQRGEAEERGVALRLRDVAKHEVLRRLVFRKVGRELEDALGGRMRIMVSGGAPLPRKIAYFFRDVGIEVLEGYGLSETCAATTLARPGRNRVGTVGQPLPGTAVRIADDGEVLIRGPGVMREYWNRPEATAEVLRDGWFHSGDIGVLDPDGSLRIVDRKKDVIVTAGGKNIAPQNIESLLKTHELFSQAVVHGDGRSYCTALITLDAEALRDFAAAQGIDRGSYAALTQRPAVRRAVQEAVDAFNEQLPPYETIRKFAILEHEFSQESGELTPTLKVRRQVINQRYKAIFDRFYEDA